MGVAGGADAELAGVRVGRQSHADFFDDDEAVADVEELKLQLVEAQRDIGADHDLLFGQLLKLGEGGALLVQEIEADVGADGELGAEDLEVIERDRELAHDIEAHAFGRFDEAGAFAVRAVEIDGALEAWPHALAGEFDDAELAHAQDFGFGAVVLEVVVKALLQLAAMALVAQVDEVADDDTAEVAQLELAGDFVGGFHVGFEGGHLGVVVIAEFAAVDVDGDDRLGGVDDKRAAAGQRNMPAVHQLDFFFDAELVEQGNGFFVQLNLVSGAGAGNLDDFLHPLGDVFIVDDDAIDISGKHIADGAGNEIAFGVELDGAGLLFLFLQDFPQAGEVFQVALDLDFGLADAGGADDEGDILRRLQTVEDLPQPAAFLVVFDLLAHAHFPHAGHHHQDFAGDGEIGAERRPLGADAFLDDLHDDFVAAAQAALDGRAIAAGHLAADGFVDVFTAPTEVGGHQVGDVEEAVAAEAEIDERGLDGRLDVGDAALVDVSNVGSGAGALHVQFVETAVLQKGDSAFFAF